jgi:hypothetical protein
MSVPGITYFSHNRDVALIAGVSFLLAAVLFFAFPIVIHADTPGYFDLSRALFNGETSKAFFFREPMLPFWMGVLGFKAGGDVAPLIFFQTLLGIANPVLVYLALRGFSKTAARIAAFLLMLTFVPYLFSKTVMAEQLYQFLLCLTLFLSVRLFVGNRLWALYAMAFATPLMGLTRSVAATAWIILFALVLFWRPRWWRHALLGSLISLSLAFGWSAYRNMNIVPGGVSPFATTFSGRVSFFNTYLSSAIGKEGGGISSKNGPSTARLENVLRHYLDSHLEEVIGTYGAKTPDDPRRRLFDQFRGDSKALANAIFTSPDRRYFGLILNILLEDMPLTEAEALLFSVFKETVRQHPDILVRYFLRNLKAYLSGGSAYYPSARWNGEDPSSKTYVAERPSWVDDVDHSNGTAYDMYKLEIEKSLPQSVTREGKNPGTVGALIFKWCDSVLPKLVSLSLPLAALALSLLFFQRSIWMWVSLFWTLLIANSALITALSVEIWPRVVIPHIPLFISGAGLLPVIFKVQRQSDSQSRKFLFAAEYCIYPPVHNDLSHSATKET